MLDGLPPVFTEHVTGAINCLRNSLPRSHLFILTINYGDRLLLRTGLVLVAPAPQVVCAVTGSLDALLDRRMGHCLQVVRPANLSEEIDKRGRKIDVIVAQLGRLVVPWEHVMVVVESLAERQRGHCGVLSRIYAPVVQERGIVISKMDSGILVPAVNRSQ